MADGKEDLEINKKGEETELVMRYRERPAGEQRFYTKVRKGMGKAKYSTLITTVPSDVCKHLGILSGDTVMWSTMPGQKVVAVMRMNPLSATSSELLFKILEKMPMDNLPEDQRKALLAYKEMVKEMGQLPPQEKPALTAQDKKKQKEFDKLKKQWDKKGKEKNS